MTSEIRLRLYEELNDFLPLNQRKRRFACTLNGIKTVQELLARLHIPRGQVELVLINGESVGFSHLLKADDFVSLYPVFESFDVTTILRARKRPLRKIRFMMGPGLLRLARQLRQLGFDVLDSGSLPFANVVRILDAEHRILLTRNAALAKSPQLSRAYYVKTGKLKDQLRDVLSRFDLLQSLHPFGPRSMRPHAPR